MKNLTCNPATFYTDSLIAKYDVQTPDEIIFPPITHISEIALMCGFSSQSSFTTTFRKLIGVTPKIYQQRT